MKLHSLTATLSIFAAGLAACSPGYMKASELESKHQGPSDCEARCVELGMRMGALVLVSDDLPGCVCQPKPPAAPAPAEAPKPSPTEVPTSGAAEQGASVATTSYVVAMAAAVAARASQNQQQKQRQQSYVPK